MGNRKSQVISLLLLMGIAALGAQVAGVGGSRPDVAGAKATRLAVLPGASIPDFASSTLASKQVKASTDETVRMSAKAVVTASTLPRAETAVVVCGIRYARDRDAAWTLGTPYETIVLKRRGSRQTVKIERSFAAPARDTYRMSVACHVSAPSKGAKVSATGSMGVTRGLPRGAAIPAG
jgi:hypothetical protein